MVGVTYFTGNRNAGAGFAFLAQYYGAQTATNFDVVADTGSPITSFIGRGFTYDSNGFFNGGTVDTMTFFQPDGSLSVQFTGCNLAVTDYRRLLTVGQSSYNFYQFVYRGDDTVVGSSGDDAFNGSDGSDKFDGGSGVDLLTFQGYHAAVAIDLAKGTAVTASGTSKVVRIEDATGTAFGDTLTGDAGNNEFQGLGGADVITGGRGFDTARYSDARSGVTVDLGVGTAIADGATDTLNGIERVIGSRYADMLTGSDADESFLGGLGNDTIDGGGGRDRAEYGYSAGSVTVSLKAGTSSGAAGADVLHGIEDVSGSVFGDTLTGDKRANALEGGDGDDVLTGGAGADLLTGGAGADRFVFESVKDSVGAKGTDTIADFAAGDRIVLTRIDADVDTAGNQAFRFVGGAAFSGAAGELRVMSDHGDTVVLGDVNGDGVADLRIVVSGEVTLVAADFAV